MFTPQKSASRSSALVGGRLSSAAKGKAVAFEDATAPPPPPPPPLSFLSGGGGGPAYGSGNMEDWRGFKEAGMLDPVAMERRDREALAESVSRLEKELHDYQYNMGLLLLEKNDLASNCDDLRTEVEEARQILKREQSAHLIAISEAEKRAENLKRALELEKSCSLDLQKALVEMSNEYEQAKDMSEAADTDARRAQLEDQRLEVEGRLRSANVQVAEADRKMREMNMKLQELESREATLVAQRQTLFVERDAHESRLQKQKEEFKTWETNLQEREKSLHDQRKVLDEREDKLRESERRYKQKDNNLDQLQKKIDLDKCALEQREVNVNKRLEDLSCQEKEVEALRGNLEKREKQLHAMEERLSDKERVEIQNLVDEHRAMLETKTEEFELEMQQKRSSLEEEFNSKLHEVEEREVEVNHKEAKLAKREQALEEKSGRVKEKEKKIQESSKALKQEESSLKKLEKQLEAERNQLSADQDSLQNIIGEIEKMRNELREKEILINDENEKLKVSEEERAEHTRLQSSLNQEMERWRHQNDLLMKETEDLRQERRRIENDWETLEEKRTTVERELKKLEEERQRFERFRHLDEEKLKKERDEMEGRIEQELESIKRERESFAAKMKHERQTLEENIRNEHEQTVQEFEQRRRELENSFQRQQEEMEAKLRQKERDFEENSSREMRNINHLKEAAEMEKEQMESGWLKLKRAREEFALNKQQHDKDRLEIHKDIDALGTLSKKLKEQRERLLHERAHFLSFIEKLKSCQNCGDFASEFVVSDLQLPAVELADPFADKGCQSVPQSEKARAKRSLDAVNVLRECASKIFNISSSKTTERNADNCHEASPVKDSPADRQDPSVGVSIASERQHTHLNKLIDEAAAEGSAFTHGLSYVGSKETEVPEESEQSILQGRRRRGGRRGGAAGGRRRQPRTSSALREADKDKDPDYNVLADVEEEKNMATSTRKRSRAKSSKTREAEPEEDSSDGLADSLLTGGRKKRKEAATVALPSPGEKRYNLRRHKTPGTASTAEPSNAKGRRSKKVVPAPSHEQGSTFDVDANSEDLRSEHQGPVSTTKAIDLSPDKAVKFKMPPDNTDTAKSAETAPREEPNSIQNTIVSEEVHETPENIVEEEEGSLYFEDDEDDGDDGDASDDPGDASLGKKLWKFFTT